MVSKLWFNVAFSVCFTLLVIPQHVAGSSYDPSTVLVLVNDTFPAEQGTNGMGASKWVGQHYAQARGISPSNILHLNIPLSVMWPDPVYEAINYADYKTYIQTPIQNYMASNNRILYIVPTYGVPFRMNPLPGDATKTGSISLDSVMAAMNSGNTNIWLPNPYYSQYNTSSPPHFRNWTNPHGWKMYIVSRLDGQSALIAAALVDKAISAEGDPSLKASGAGYYDWHGSSGWPDNTFHGAYALGSVAGAPNNVLNNQATSGEANFAPASTYAYSTGGVSIFARFNNTVTMQFSHTATGAGSFKMNLKVADNYYNDPPGLARLRLYAADFRSYWELSYMFDSTHGPAVLKKVINETMVGSCSFKVPPTYPIDTNDITFTFSDNQGEAFKNGISQCSFSDPGSNHLVISTTQVVFRDMTVNLSGVHLQDASGVNLWNDSLVSDTTRSYQWTTKPQECPNALFNWGWYGKVHDSYTFVNGSVGAQLNSWSANYLRFYVVPERDLYWTEFFIQKGITATWGATGEPYTNGYAYGDILLGHFWRGYNFGESAYIANPFLNWMMIFIGDPLYSPEAFANNVPEPPVINSATTAVGTFGEAFSYQIKTVGGDADSYAATGLPAGLSINKGTGLISGTLGVSGVFTVTLTATNSSGTGTATLTVGPPRIRPR